jgi:hypothetical protein
MNMQALRALAAVMDQRVSQLEAAGISGDALIERMVGHLPDLQQIWVGADEQQLAMLCQDYPGFYQYASLMEAAAEAQRAKPPRGYLEMPELEHMLKPLLTGLLTEAATLERAYQSLIDTADRRGMEKLLEELNQRHRDWLRDRERFVAALKDWAYRRSCRTWSVPPSPRWHSASLSSKHAPSHHEALMPFASDRATTVPAASIAPPPP